MQESISMLKKEKEKKNQILQFKYRLFLKINHPKNKHDIGNS